MIPEKAEPPNSAVKVEDCEKKLHNQSKSDLESCNSCVHRWLLIHCFNSYINLSILLHKDFTGAYFSLKEI